MKSRRTGFEVRHLRGRITSRWAPLLRGTWTTSPFELRVKDSDASSLVASNEAPKVREQALWPSGHPGSD